MRSRSTLFAGHFRLIVWLLSFGLVAWILLGTNTVGAFLTFCLSGTLPGTSYIVPPNVVMLISAIGCGVVLTSFFGRIYIGHLKRRAGYVWTRQSAPSAHQNKAQSRVAQQPAPQLHAAADTKSLSTSHAFSSLSIGLRFQLTIASWQRHLYDRLGGTTIYFRTGLSRLAAWFLVLLARAMIFTVISVGLIARFIIRLVKKMSAFMRHVWYYMEPRLWTIDAWLEKRYVLAGAMISRRFNRLIMSHEIASTLGHVFKNLRSELYKSPHDAQQTKQLSDRSVEVTKQ